MIDRWPDPDDYPGCTLQYRISVLEGDGQIEKLRCIPRKIAEEEVARLESIHGRSQVVIEWRVGPFTFDLSAHANMHDSPNLER